MASIQNAFGEPELSDLYLENSKIEIPVEPVLPKIPDYEDSQKSRTIDYTENLWVISDDGIFDSDGNYTNEITEKILPDFQIEEDDDEDGLTTLRSYQLGIIESWGGKKAFAEKRLKGVKENLNDQIERFKKLEEEIENTETKLDPVREEIETLQSHIELMNLHIRVTKEKITNTEVMIAEKRIKLKDLMLSLKRNEIELDIQKKIVTDYIRLLYAEEEQFFDLYNEGSSTLKLLLADSSISENLLGAEYLSIMEETGRKVFYDLEYKYRELEEQKNNITEEQNDLEFLYNALLNEKRSVEETRLSKKELLEKTKGEEEAYQMLLDQAIQEQLETAISVQNLQENIQMIEGKLAILDEELEDINAGKSYEELRDINEKIELAEDEENTNDVNEEVNIEKSKPFIWPVPANKITAEFHDPTYPKRWGVHNAIDIRAKQFTEIIAPANGYVFQTKDSGKGYSYIILAHKNSIVTVYGHVSEIKAKPGTVVKKGDIIGLSGGTPGTKGAGLQTTGPHLHFEMHKKGEPVNPLDYLPLEELPIEYVPDEYLKKLK